VRVIELFSGIGGVAEAVRGRAEIVAAVDHDQRATAAYAGLHGHAPLRKNLESLRWKTLPSADLWWMSPPCKPYTIRGAQRDLDDPRSKAFLSVLAALKDTRPEHVALENVPWFEGSQGHQALLDALGPDYAVTHGCLCPTDLGLNYVRRRFYLVASRTKQVAFDLTPQSMDWRSALEDMPEGTEIPHRMVERFGDAFHVVDSDDPNADVKCFTSAYAKSPVYAGSYLRQHGQVRFFHPREIARIMGFEEPPPFPTIKVGWKLVGNSLSVHAVRAVLGGLLS